MSRHVSTQEWALTRDSIDSHAEALRLSQQSLFRVFQAASKRDWETAEKYWENGAPLDLPLDTNEKTGVPGALALMPADLGTNEPLTLMGWAAWNNDMVTIDWALDHGASPMMVMAGGRDPAWLAMENSSDEAYTRMMGVGANPRLRLSDGSMTTRLMGAVRARSLYIVGDLLRRHKVDANQWDRAGKTALHHNLAQDPYTEDDGSIGRMLLELGGNPNMEDNEGIPAHALAITDLQQALLAGYRLAAITDEVRRKLEAPPAEPEGPDPRTDPGFPQMKNPPRRRL